MISLALRHGSPPRLQVEQLMKDKDSDMFSIARCVARILKPYITDGEPAGDKACHRIEEVSVSKSCQEK